MTTEAGKEKEKIAKGHHESGRYDEAVESYTAAAYEYFGVDGLDHSVTVARGLKKPDSCSGTSSTAKSNGTVSKSLLAGSTH